MTRAASALAGLPETAPFPAEQIALLNSVLAGASHVQRAWLSGFLAGLDAGSPQSLPASPPAARPKLAILFASESGNAEALAASAKKAASRQGFAATVHDLADISLDQLATMRDVMVFASTWGEGDPPQRVETVFAALMSPRAPRLDQMRFAVLGLGDRAYPKFCAVAEAIDGRLAALGATRLVPMLACDVDYQQAATGWIGTTLTSFAPERMDAEIIPLETRRPPSPALPQANRPFAATITEHINLHSSRSSAETVHLELSLAESGITYEPGDALAVQAKNHPAMVEALLHATGHAGNAALAETLLTGRDITTLTPPMLATYADLSNDAALRALVENKQAAADWIASHLVIDLLRAAPAKPSAEALLAMLRPLPPRYYSIASSQKAVGDQADLLVALFSFQHETETRHGVASHYLTRQLRRGDTVPVWVKPNPHFRLPADPTRPVIMIGPGTGVAPFRAFLQDRRETGATGRNWLFFGHRNYTHDFLYQLEWQDAHKDGLLTRIDLAFSRDQPEKIYVQHRLWQQRAALLDWLADGAHLYVCGDRRMGQAIDATLARILTGAGRDAEQEMAALRQQGRYLKDVY